MRTARWVTVFLLVVGVVGCSSGGGVASTMPDVTGKRLDVAKSDIKRAGFEEKVEVLGGGTFGVVEESNWLVCEQLPATGEAIEDSPRLTVDRSCGGEATGPADTIVPSTTVQPAAEESTARGDAPAPAPTGIDAEAMEAAFIAGLGRPIQEMCASARNDPTWTKGPHWACFYDGVEAGPSYLRINLTTYGAATPGELDERAYDTGLAWFNFIGCKFPNLDMIVVTIDGLDNNVPRSSTKADLLCN